MLTEGLARREPDKIYPGDHIDYSFLEDWVNKSTDDPWAVVEIADGYSGTAVKNQTGADGIYMACNVQHAWKYNVVGGRGHLRQ